MAKRFVGVVLFGLILFIYFFKTPSASHVMAASLTSVADTITTSRPSAASPLNANLATTDVTATIYDNGSRYLASDSARIRRTSDDTDIVTGLTVASQSAARTTVYFTAAAGTAAQAGKDVLVTNITAVHTVSFINPNPIPIGGKIKITFPGSATNPNYASPSATMFSFNGLSASNIKLNLSAGTATCSFAITLASNLITCTTATAAISAGTTVTILIGCSSAAAATCAVANQVPSIINPSKTAAAGTADTWTVTVQTTDGSDIEIDSAKSKIGTIESVQVLANVDPTLTFTIAAVTDGAAINTGNTTGCTNTEISTAGITTTATVVNLGTLSQSSINIAAQLITITTNAANGYSLTATSSGHLINPATGFWITDSTTPTVMTAGTTWFGVHPCGLDVTSGTWATGATGGGAGAKYGWPTQIASVTLASDSVGPVGNSIATGNGLTSVEYAGTVDVSIPAGQYASAITYVATPTF